MSALLDYLIAALTLALLVALVLVAIGAPRAWAAEYEILAERSSGALLREDEPNVRRIRAKDEEPYVSLEDCRQAIKGVSIDRKLGSGWRLRCRPVDVPLPRVVVR